ncbi:HIT domain-containing protein [Candidatus Woesearchaeota archaeon]|nr:HIT domain-containing protein [Candidatus Woesearchaeota archaeon]
MPEQQTQQQLSPEQIKALQEKLKNMSPEELKEFQKKQCIFCQIIAGKVQSRKVYEDDSVIAVLDVNPANPGHMLIMPKEHYSIMPQMPDEETGHIFAVSKALSNAALRSLDAQGSNIIVANGIAAGQRAQHFMVHLIPRKENDNLSFQVPQKTIGDSELKKIRKVLSDSMGTKAEEPVIVPLPKISKEKKVVNAEFEEKKQQEKPKQLKKSKEGITEKKHKTKTQESGINLDDIAKVLGAR